MDKTIKINLGGTLFQIDEEAYKILRRYLQSIDDRLKNTPGGAETIEDIESRIAEIFQTQGGSAAVISRDNVEAMIAIIGKPEDFDTGSEQPARSRETFSRPTSRKKTLPESRRQNCKRSLRRTWFVLNIEAVWVRLLFIIFTCFFSCRVVCICCPLDSPALRLIQMPGKGKCMAVRIIALLHGNRTPALRWHRVVRSGLQDRPHRV